MTTKILITTILSTVSTLLLFPNISYAAIIASQDQYSSDVGNYFTTSAEGFQGIGSGFNSTIKSATMKIQWDGTGSAPVLKMRIDRFPTSSYSATNQTNFADDVTLTTGINYVNFNFSSTTAMDPTQYYTIGFTYTGAPVRIYGSNSNVYINGTNSICFAKCGSILDYYFTLSDTEDSISLTGTPTVTWINPTNHASTTAGSTSFQFSYTSPPLSFINQYRLTVYDTTNPPFPTLYNATGTITTATGTISNNITLLSDHLYMACVTLSNPGIENASYTTPCITFSTGANFTTAYNNSIETAGLIPFGSGTNGCDPPNNILDVGGGLTYAFCVLFIPSNNVINQYASIPTLIASKFPFSYISGLQDAFTAVSDESASTTPGASFTFPLGATFTNPGGGSATTTFSIFNPSTIVASVPLVTTMRTYISYIIYFMFGIFAFRRVMKLI